MLADCDNYVSDSLKRSSINFPFESEGQLSREFKQN